ncbi:hypothetical protein [Paludibaculum fermentans]|uniref:Uncharacterized protein n=1 Tax=Paludibaculum fermentans TaxID=1473598 RepID=A0A7S7NSC2_PALFE|nr:hypothetical protein [Paludibaculum fermentans]QOY88858.1 hypothetical protein IRI77_02540 [Paludibaculum fermentans]
MTRFFGLVTVRRRKPGTEDEAVVERTESRAEDSARPLGLSLAPGLSVLPEISRMAAEELKRKTEAQPEPVAARPAPAEVPEKVVRAEKPARPETRWERAVRLRELGMREERIAADLGVLPSDLRLRWKLESLRAERPVAAGARLRMNS